MNAGKYRVAILAALVSLLCASASFAANGDTFVMNWGQRENGQNLTDVTRQFKDYEDTSASTCYDGATWCCKSTNNQVKLKHYHLDTDTNGDLSSTEQTRADTYLAYVDSWASSTNRTASASAPTNCHGWALDRSTVWLVDQSTMLSNDYNSVSLGNLQVGDRCKHQYDHTSKITQLSGTGCSQTVDKVEQKCGKYGRYTTGPSDISDYGGPVGYYRQK